jgi:ABC-type transport system involved in multi-copper enzyme maturation permease subunit
MTWLVWRQHRQQALAAVVALLAVALFLVPTGRQMRAAFDDLGLGACLRAAPQTELVTADTGCLPLSEEFSGRFQSLGLVSLLLLFLPALVGLFWGAPLVARELEHGTHRLVWTQGVTRLRWATVKLGLVGAGVALVAAAYTLLVGWWIAPLNDATGYRFTWLFFDQQGPVLVGYALFALALGVLAGTLTGKVLPAMAVTLGGFLATRVAVALLLRPRFLPPLRRAYPVVGATPTESNPLIGDWVISRGVYSAQGVKLTPGSGTQALCDQTAAARCIAKYGVGAYNQDLFQPADRFWLFQGIETALFVALAVVLVLVAVRLIRRRTA